MTTTADETLASEQAYFDDAWEAREASRKTLEGAGAAAGGPQKTAAAVNRAAKAAITRMSSADEAVAFGRIDIGDGPLYVGTHAISNDERDLLVINWQAPAAKAYYEATFDAPMGIALKRTFTCERNAITRFDDVVFADLAQRVADLSASPEEQWGVDDALLRDLDSSRTGEMRDIVQTIHAAQYRLIRTPSDRLLVIQGGPGTGKTAVALHRVSWLLFNQSEDIKPEDVLVVGPSDTFTKYIRGVLPGLGDDNVEYRDLGSLGPQTATGRNETTSTRRIKGELRMASLLRTALWQRVRFPERMEIVEVGTGFGAPRFTRTEVDAELAQHTDKPYNQGRAAFRSFIQREVEGRSHRGVTVTPATLDAAVERIWPSLSTTAFLRDLLGSRDRLLAAAGDLFTGNEIGKLFRQASDKISDEQWSDVDVALLDEADELMSGRPPATYKHVVVDEAQDLSPMQLRSLARRSANGSMTVVGDLAQSTGPWARDSWANVTDLLARKGVEQEFQELELGYRVPRQIYEFAAKLLPYAAPGLTPPTVVRYGPSDPDLVRADEWEIVQAGVAAARAHAGSGRFVGVICPDRHRRKLEEDLTWHDVTWANVGAGKLDASINIARPSESKGLEFDAVVVIDPQAVVDESEWGLRQLYIALTRTTRYLTVVHTGEPLPLPIDETPSDALLELAEVRGLEQQALFRVPERPMGGITEAGPGHGDESTRPDLATEGSAVPVGDLPGGGRPAAPRTLVPGRLAAAMVDAAAEALAKDIRDELPEELWPAVVSALQGKLESGPVPNEAER